MSNRQNQSGGSWIIAIVGCAALYSCLHKDSDKTEDQHVALRGDATPTVLQHAATTFTIDREFDEGAAREAAVDELSGMSFQDEQGYLSCTDDCSGHEAGWIAARDDEEDCGGGSSESYDAGCTAYLAAIDARVTRAREAFDNGDDAFVQE